MRDFTVAPYQNDAYYIPNVSRIAVEVEVHTVAIYLQDVH